MGLTARQEIKEDKGSSKRLPNKSQKSGGMVTQEGLKFIQTHDVSIDKRQIMPQKF